MEPGNANVGRDLTGAGWIRAQADEAPGITIVGVPTRDRTRSLTRCLETCLESSRRHGRTLTFAVADDSSCLEVRQANREAISNLETRYGVRIAYIGPDEKRQLIRALVRQGGFDPNVLEFALLNPEGCPLATGGNRNSLLLHTVGEMLLQLDDDTLCQAMPTPGAQEGLAWSSLFDPTEFWFLNEEQFPETDEATEVLALHEQLLGREPGDCWSRPTFDVEQTRTAFFRPAAHAAGKVLVTSAGVVGHSGMSSSLYFLRLQGASRQRLIRSEAIYRRAFADHRVLRGVTQATLCDSAYCMAVNLGLDNRGLLPPFFPVQRNQDGVFAALLRAVRPDGYQGFLPWAVRHEPMVPRRFSQHDLLRSVVGLSTGQTVQALVRSMPEKAADLGDRSAFRSVGKTLEEWSALAQVDFEQQLRIRLGPSQNNQAVQLASLLQQFRGLPEFWGSDARQALAVLLESLPARRYSAPSDLSAKGEDEAARLFQRLVGRFGRLLCCWPDVVEAARTLRENGVHLGDGLQRAGNVE